MYKSDEEYSENNNKKQEQEQEKVTLYFWKQKRLSRNFSHVSLEIEYKTIKYYISFYPINQKSRQLCTEGTFKSKDKDFEYYEDEVSPLEVTLSKLELDLHKMISTYQDLKARTLKYTLCSGYLICYNSYNCSTLVFRLLEEGGIKNYLPANEHFGTSRHLLSLQYSRLFTSALLLSPILYNLAYHHSKNSKVKNVVMSCSTSLLSSIIVYFFERRKFKEISCSDAVIGITASLGFASFVFLHEIFISPKIRKLDSLALKVLADFGFSIPGTCISSITIGWITSQLVNLCGGNSYMPHPDNVYIWAKYASGINIKEGATKKRRYLFWREFSFSTIIYSAWIVEYAMTKLNYFKHEINVNLGISAGLTLGSFLSFLIDKYALKPCLVGTNREIITKKSASTNNSNSKENNVAKNQVVEKSRFEYSLVNITMGLGMLFLFICVLKSTESPCLTILLGTSGCVLGYLIGEGLFILSPKLPKMCPNSLQQRPRVLHNLNVENHQNYHESSLLKTVRKDDSSDETDSLLSNKNSSDKDKYVLN